MHIKRKTPIGDGNTFIIKFIKSKIVYIKRKTPIGDGNCYRTARKMAGGAYKKKDPDRGRKHFIAKIITFRLYIKRKTPIGDGNYTLNIFLVVPFASYIKRKTPIGDGNFKLYKYLIIIKPYKKKDPDRGRKLPCG